MVPGVGGGGREQREQRDVERGNCLVTATQRVAVRNEDREREEGRERGREEMRGEGREEKEGRGGVSLHLP